MKALNVTALVLVIIGAINWLLVGLLAFDLVAALFGEMTIITRVIYILVGLAGLYCFALLPIISRSPEHRTVHA